MLQHLKRAVERVGGCKIYRNRLPRGTDLIFDLQRTVGSENIRVVLDVGANVGQSALRYVEHFPNAKVYAFEPVSSVYQKMVSELAGHPRIEPVHQAVGATEGSVQIHIGDHPQTASVVHGDASNTETVAQTSVDAFCRARSLAEVDLLKIDVEGYEMRVLEGAAGLLERQCAGFVELEAEPVASDRFFVPMADITAFVGRFGYSLFGIYDQQPSWDGQKSIMYLNVVYISPKLVSKDVGPHHYPLR